MARPKTAQPNHSLRKVAAVVATAVSGMSVYAQAAEQPKQEETITVVAAPAAQESAWGPAPTIAAVRPPMTWSPFAASPPRRPSTPTSIWTA